MRAREQGNARDGERCGEQGMAKAWGCGEQGNARREQGNARRTVWGARDGEGVGVRGSKGIQLLHAIVVPQLLHAIFSFSMIRAIIILGRNS